MKEPVARPSPTSVTLNPRRAGEAAASVSSVPAAPTAQQTQRELGASQLFSGLDANALDRLATVARRVELPAGETVFSQGDAAEAFFILARGEVKVYKLLRDGRTATLRYVRPGDTFAESALDDSFYPAHTETTAPSVLYRFQVREFKALLLDEPELALEVLARMARLLVHLNRRVEELLLPVPARLARFLLDLCGEQSGPSVVSSDAARSCRLPMTKRDLAARLGTVPETLSRALSSLKRARVVRLRENGEVVEVLDLEALARIAQY